MRRYIESAFRVKWRLILAAIVICALASGALYMSKLGIYTSSAGVWVDRPIYAPTDPGTNIYNTPSSVQAGIFAELLQTHQFTLEIAKRANIPMPNTAIEGQVVDDLQKKLSVDAVGPHLIRVSYTANKQTYVQAVVLAAIQLFQDESTSSGLAQAQQTLKVYQQQISTDQSEMNKAKDALTSYIQAHPGVSNDNAAPDPTYNALNQQYLSDRQRVDDTQAKIDDLNFRIQAKVQLGDITYKVIDDPSKVEPYKLTTRDLIKNEGIALALAIVAVIGLVLVNTWTDRAVYTLNDISTLSFNEQSAGSSDLLVGVVPYVKSLALLRQQLVKYEGARKPKRRRGRKPHVQEVNDTPPTRTAPADGVVRTIEVLPEAGIAGGRSRN